MRAVAADSLDVDPTVQEVPDPRPGAGELLVEVKAAAINPFDHKVARGEILPDLPRDFPYVYGGDFAGVVTALGEGAGSFSVGDKVFGQFLSNPGGHGSNAEYVAVPEKGAVTAIPEGVSFAEAASIGTAGMTAQQIVDSANLNAGESLLIIGAGGGVGSFLIQLAAARDLRVIAATRGDERARLGGFGAARTIDVDEESLGEAVRDEYPDGVDALVDLASQDSEVFAQHAALVGDGGVALTTNFVADESRTPGNIEVINFGMQGSASSLDTVAAAIAAATLKAPIEYSVSIDEAPERIAELRSGKGRGKAVIVF
ncbi:NADP-dependent oxidoreductase [Salininema proteolyticum]|uniref:NADP-dependent oxidoreductase n=1 Tax=Salininema proteolyticum TaxID=1607685 RepID=A0ABV8TZP7_9ACTN